MNNYDFNGKKILVADDDFLSRVLIDKILEKTGAKVIHAENGAKAVNKVATENIDLILMDIRMPVMDGYAAAKNIRDMGLTMPIIAYTALTGDRQKCMDEKFNDYLVKPVLPESILSMIDKYLK